MQRLRILIPFLMLSSLVNAQLPDTDIWLFDLKERNGILSPENGKNISNRTGYDNQPYFSENGKSIYFVSIRLDNQADIYEYLIGQSKTIQLTKTSESEYSPQPDGTDINAVVVEKDSSQKIHLIDSKSGIHKNAYEEDSVGYYFKLSKDSFLVYKLTMPHSLILYNSRNGNTETIAINPTRTFKKISSTEFVFGIKDSSKVFFYKYNLLLRKAFIYANFANPNEDINWHPKHGLLISDGAKIMKFDEISKNWVLLFDFINFGIKKITRFGFDSKDKRIVIVNNL